MPFIVALLFAIIVQLPLSWLLFAGPRRRVNEAMAASSAHRRSERERLRAALAGEDASGRRVRGRDIVSRRDDRRGRQAGGGPDPAGRSGLAGPRGAPDRGRSAAQRRHPSPAVSAAPGLADAGIDLYLKDESTHVTGSLKHRLARSLFLYALCNGWLTERTTVIESSSGSTAVSEAYFARMIGLPFVAVMPAGTSPEKIALIQAQGGRCHLVDDPAADLRRVAPARRRVRRPLHGPVHLRRAGHRLAGQQQHRRVDLRPARAGAAPGAASGSSSGPEPAAPARPSAGTSATAATRPGCASPTRRVRRSSPPGGTGIRPARRLGVADRGHRPAAGRAVVRRADRRPDAPGAGRRVGGHNARARDRPGRRVGPSTGTSLWACFELIAQLRDDGARRVDRHPAVRFG